MRAGFGVMAAVALWAQAVTPQGAAAQGVTGPAATPQAAAQGPVARTVPQVTTLQEVPQNSLYVGNSFFYFNNGISSLVQNIGRGLTAAPQHRGTMAVIGGSGFDWHDVESYFRPNAIGSYVFDERNNIIFNKAERKFDTAILMDCSQCPIHPTLAPVFTKYAKLHSDTVRKHGATPILFMSWAYQDHPEMTAQLAEAYTKAGNANDALVIPAGLAFARALKDRPGLVLHIADKRHPTMAGSYLAAATTYGALYGRSPEASTYTAGLDPELAAFLRAEAWSTVRDYFAGAVVN